MHMHMHEKPEAVWYLPADPWEEPSALSPEERDRFLIRYDDTGWEPDVDALHDRIDCDYVEAVTLPGIGVLWVDESGRLAKRTTNPVARILYARTRGAVSTLIQGPAVLVVAPDAPKDRVEAAIQQGLHAYQYALTRGSGVEA